MNRSWLIAIILFLALSLPLVVYVTQQSQELRQRAQDLASPEPTFSPSPTHSPSPTPTPTSGVTPPSCPSDTQLLFANTGSLNIGKTLTAGGTISSLQGSWSIGTRDGVLVAGGGQKMGVNFANFVLLDTVLMFDNDPKSGESPWSINGVSLPVTGGGKWGSYKLDLLATQMNFDNGGDSPHFNVCVKESQPSPTPTPRATPSLIPLSSPTPTATPGIGGPNPSPSPTPSPTPTECNASCSTNVNCPSNMICYIPADQTTGACRNPLCQTDTDCVCSQPQVTPSPALSAMPSVPVAGTSWPTIFLVIGGFALLILGLALP